MIEQFAINSALQEFEVLLTWNSPFQCSFVLTLRFFSWLKTKMDQCQEVSSSYSCNDVMKNRQRVQSSLMLGDCLGQGSNMSDFTLMLQLLLIEFTNIETSLTQV